MIRLFLPLAFGVALTTGALATPVTDFQEGYTPYSRTAQAITGPIIVSREKLVFGTGAVVDLKIVSEGVRAAWGMSGEVTNAQIFEMQSDPGALVNDNTLCGQDTPARYITFYQEEFLGSWLLEVGVYGGNTPPTQLDTPDLCGTFNYEMLRPVPDGM